MADQSKSLRIYVCTWNVAEKDPLNNKEIFRLLQFEQSDDVDVYAVGFQEIKTGARETVNSFIYYDDWASALSNFLSKHGFYMVENTRVQGISLCVFAKISHLPYIRFVRTEIERTGVASAWGNKGGVAVSCWLYGQRVCFLNVHLSAHLHSNNERIKNIEEIFSEMEFGGNSTVQSHDLVLLFGDTNFRLDDFTREFIIATISKKNYSVLWEKDQLKKQQESHNILSEFEEAQLNFDPTYKYDPGTDTYDTSEKKRKPAWTDRILWRINPEFRSVQQKRSCATPPFILKVVEKSFTDLKSFKQSDHKPVVCQFDLKILSDAIHEPLLRVEPSGSWRCGHRGRYTVEPFEGMEWDSKDYVALYKDELKDFRSYKAYSYVKNYERDDSSTSQSSDEEAIEAGFLPDERKKIFAFKKYKPTDPGIFRLGYFSHNMQCLVAVSSPFEVRKTG